MTFGNLNQNIYTAVKVYTPGQFYAAGGVVEEMFYQEVGWGDFWVIPMTVEGFMGTLYYGTYSKDEVREIYESKGIGLI